MPAKRWDVDINEIVQWMIKGEHDFAQMVMDFGSEEDSKGSSSGIESSDLDGTIGKLEVPNRLPILPLRGLVVFPTTAVPLTIGQPRSIRLVEDVFSSNKWIGLVTSRKADIENPAPTDLYQYGTAALIHRMFRAPDGTLRLLVQGIERFKIKKFVQESPYTIAEVVPRVEKVETGLEIEALIRNVRNQFLYISELIPSIPRELVATINTIDDPLQIAYNIANLQRMEIETAQNLLELDSSVDKLRLLVSILTKESEVLDLGKKIQNDAKEEIDKIQREYFLREQLRAIQKELGEDDPQAMEIADFEKRIIDSGMSDEPLKQANLELERLGRLPAAAAEYGVIRSYLDWLVSLPWTAKTEDNLDIKHAREVLDKDHYGLKDVKNRIVEYLAVRKLKLEIGRAHV